MDDPSGSAFVCPEGRSSATWCLPLYLINVVDRVGDAVRHKSGEAFGTGVANATSGSRAVVAGVRFNVGYAQVESRAYHIDFRPRYKGRVNTYVSFL